MKLELMNNPRLKSGEEKQKAEKPIRHYDYTLVILTAMLVIFGLIMVCSASSYTAAKENVSPTFYLMKQLRFAIFGFALMIVVSLFSVNIYRKRIKVALNTSLIFWFALFCAALQVFVLFAGESTNGSTRWIQLPVIGRFQPSELTKLCVILLIAYLVSTKPRTLDSVKGFVSRMFWPVVLAALVVKENLSTAIVIVVIAFAVCFIASRKWIYFLASAVILSVAAIIGIFTVGYRADRIDQWLHVEENGYQILQSLYAICSGGWFGKGLGNGTQKLGYVPEVHTDMIFSVIAEELGILGIIVLLIVYILLLHRIYKVIVNARDLYSALICVGVFIHIALQVLMNIAIATNSIPSTGVTLPFISYGGTSLMATLIEMGLVISVSNRIEYEE